MGVLPLRPFPFSGEEASALVGVGVGPAVSVQDRGRCLGPSHSICRLSITPTIFGSDDLLLSSAVPAASKTDTSSFQLLHRSPCQGHSARATCWGGLGVVGFHSCDDKASFHSSGVPGHSEQTSPTSSKSFPPTGSPLSRNRLQSLSFIPSYSFILSPHPFSFI